MAVLFLGCLAVVLPSGDRVPLRLTERPPATSPPTTEGALPPVGIIPEPETDAPAGAIASPAQLRPTAPITVAPLPVARPLPIRRKHGIVAFDRADRQGHWDVAVLLPGAFASNVVTPGTSDDRRPAISPDGQRIAFSSNRNNPVSLLQTVEDIYVMNVDGSNVQRLTTVPVGNYYGSSYPAWSPDGTQIAYVSDANHPRRTAIWVMNADGSGPRPIAELDGAYSPTWSPDGRLIAVLSGQVGVGVAAWAVGPDGSNMRRVAEAAPGMWSSWLADGRLLLDRALADKKVLSALDITTGSQTMLPRAQDMLDIRSCGRDQLLGARRDYSQLVLTGLDDSSPTVIETAPAGWRLGSMSCTNPL